MTKKPTRRKTNGNPTPPKNAPAKSSAKRAGKTSKTVPKSQLKSDRVIAVVGIGASAGGLDAFNRLFEAMPADSGAAFVLIQHLDPTHKSLTADLVAKHTAMPVVEAQDDLRVEANHVYTIPPNTDLAFDDGRLRLTEPTRRRGVRAPIDFLFSSLAEGLQEKAIGIVLSGAGSDGALGLKAIEGHDGMTMAQTPETAQYDSMPKSAIATGCVDHVLPVGEMPGALTKYLRHSYTNGGAHSATDTAAATDGVKSILALLHARTGQNLDHYKSRTLVRRISRRMGLIHVEDHAEYLKLLREDQAEVAALVKDLFIGVTEFFRDPPAWEALEQEIIKPLVARKGDRATIRIWSAGCATGDEAYSIAMVLIEQCELARKNCKLQVFASDIVETSLAFARTGVYPANIAENVGQERLRRFFTELDGGDHYRVGKQLRETVVFAAQNLLSDPPFSRLDLILCRNLLIYLEPIAQKKLIPLFHFALQEQGALFLGNAETIGGDDDLFQTLDKKWRVFKRIGPTRYERLYHPELADDRTPRANETASGRERISHGVALAQRQLLGRFVPAAVLIDQDYNLLHFWGATEDYLVQPAGAPTQKLLAQLRQGLRNKLKSAVSQALRDHETVVADARVKRGNAIPRVSVTVTAVRELNQSKHLLLITFEDRQEAVAAAPREPDADESLTRQLEAELKIAKEDLQTHIEQSESANEELKAANEEVTSINEELHATNEELETSKEELQSVNEELTTVNHQLQEKLEEVEEINADLKNLMDSTDTATIFLDRQFRITRFTPATTQLLPLVSTDVGRLISVFAQKFDLNLLRDAEVALEKIFTVEADVKTDDGQWYQRRLMPYHTADHRIGGVVVTYSNITALKNEQRRSASALKELKTVNTELDQRVSERTAIAERRAVELRNLASELSFAEERERQKLAADLHEGLSQSLALVNVKLSSLQTSLKGNNKAQRELEAIAELLSHANESVRTHIYDLSPPVLEDFGLIKALEWLAEDLRKTHGLEVEVHHSGELEPLHERIRCTLFRAARELLINVVKHAGVDRATVTLERGERKIRLVVEDAGIGFDPDKVSRGRRSGFGLGSILERLSYLGGEMKTESTPGNGAKIILLAPLHPEERRMTTG